VADFIKIATKNIKKTAVEYIKIKPTGHKKQILP
jgi:hypothetical protein